MKQKQREGLDEIAFSNRDRIQGGPSPARERLV